MTTDKLIPLRGLPYPANLPELLGYTRPMPRVAFYWEADHLVWKDARSCANLGEWYVWRRYTEHPRIQPFFAPYEWYDEAGPGPTFLLYDHTKERWSVGPIEAVDDAVGRDPIEVPLFDAPKISYTQQDLDYIVAQLDRTAPEVIERVREKHADRIRQMERWLRTLAD